MTRSVRRLIAIVLALSSVARADDGFLRTVSKLGACFYWPEREYRLHHAPASLNGRGFVLPERQAIEKAMSSWATVASSCSDFRFVMDASLAENRATGGVSEQENSVLLRTRACDGIVPASDRCRSKSDTRFDDCGSKYECWLDDEGPSLLTLAVTRTNYKPKSGVVTAADIVFHGSALPDGRRAQFTTTDVLCDATVLQACVKNDLQAIMTHEIGHAIGLDHVKRPSSLMYESDTGGTLEKRAIDPGSITGFCHIYPRNEATPACSEEQALSAPRPETVAETEGCSAAHNHLWWLLSGAAISRFRRRRW